MRRHERTIPRIIALAAGALLAAAPSARSEVVQVWNDDFSGATLNENLKWDNLDWGNLGVSQTGGVLVMDTRSADSDWRAGRYVNRDQSGAISDFEGAPLFNFWAHPVTVRLDFASTAGIPLADSRNVFCLTLSDASPNGAATYLSPANGVVVRLERLIAGSPDGQPYWRVAVNANIAGSESWLLYANLSALPSSMTCTFDRKLLSIDVTGAVFAGGGTNRSLTLPDLSGAITNWQIGLGAVNSGNVLEKTAVSLEALQVTVGAPPRPPPDGKLRVLMIGNSYTRLVAQSGHFPNFFQQASIPNEIEFLSTDAMMLMWHCTENASATIQKIRSKPWDVIIVQEYSANSGRSFRDYLAYGADNPRTLAGYISWAGAFNLTSDNYLMAGKGGIKITETIRDHADLSRLSRVIYWSNHGRHKNEWTGNSQCILWNFFHPDDNFRNLTMKDYTANHFKAIQQHCAMDPAFLANAIRVQVALVGSAFDECWHRGPNYQLTWDDWSHPDSAGAYLISALLFEQVTGVPALAVPYAGGLDSGSASYLRGLAGRFGGLPRVDISTQNQRPVLSWSGAYDGDYGIERSTTMQPGSWQLLPLVCPTPWMDGQTGERYGPLQFTDDEALGMDRVFYRVVRQ